MGRNRRTLQGRLQKLSATRAALLNRVRLATTSQQSARPQPERWSVIEALEHLVLAEQVVLQTARAYPAVSAEPRTWKDRVRHLLVILVLRTGIPVRAPSRRMLSAGTMTLDDTESLWSTSEGWLEGFVTPADRNGMHHAVFRHPVAGRITLAQAVRMNQVHIDRRRRQIERLLRASAQMRRRAKAQSSLSC